MSAEGPLDVSRLARLIALIAFVSAVFLVTAASTLTSQLYSIAVVVVGSIAVVTAIIGTLIASATYGR